MNKHYKDALYYQKRAGEHALLGAKETFEPVESRVRELTGRESDPEPVPERGRFGAVLEDVKDVERNAEREAREVIGSARRRVGAYRSRQ